MARRRCLGQRTPKSVVLHVAVVDVWYVLTFCDGEPRVLAVMPLLGWLYPLAEPGRAYLRSLPTVITSCFADHMFEDHPERLAWLDAKWEDIGAAVARPSYVSRHLRFKGAMGHWTVELVGRVPCGSGYTLIAVSLANLPGQPESDYHQVITIHPLRRRGLHARGAHGGEELSERWLAVQT